MRLILPAALCLLLTACPGPVPEVREPVAEDCPRVCLTPCPLTRDDEAGRLVAIVPLWQPPDPDAPDAWDTYPPQVTLPLRGALLQCEINRRACVACLDGLKAAGTTR
jgi:hypothetical protein